jgi:hypothetical protein
VRRTSDTTRRVIAFAAAYGIGLAALMVAIAAADSRIAAGIALAWILGVLLYARHELRCPLCGASVLNASVGSGLRWLAAANRRCPRCRANYDDAARAQTSARNEEKHGTARDPKETRR